MFRKNAGLLNRPLKIFVGTMILANIASGMQRPLLPLYLQSLGADINQVGLFFTLAAVAPLAFQILGGWLSDSIGRLQAVAIGSLAGMVSYIVILVAPTWHWLLIAVAAMAMASSFVAPSFQAFIAEQAKEENLGRVYGLTEGLFMVVGIIGPPLGGYLSDKFNFRVMFLVAALLYGSATVIRLIMARGARRSVPETGEKPSFKGLKASLLAMVGLLLGGGVITWIFISDGVRDIAYNMSFQFEPLYLQNEMGLTNSQIGLLSSFAALTTMMFMTAAGWLSDKKGERVGIVGGFAIIALGLGIFLSSRTFAGFAVAWVMYGLGYALIGPAYNSLISKSVPNKLRGTAFGLFSTSIGVLALPAPLVGSALWNRFSPRAPFLVPLVATVLLLPVMWVKFKLPPKEKEQEIKGQLEIAPATGD
jgi:MFS family permease